MSEVFVDVWRNAGRFEGRSQVATWILGIARHKALAAARRRPIGESDDDMASIEDPSCAALGRNCFCCGGRDLPLGHDKFTDGWPEWRLEPARWRSLARFASAG